MAERQVKIDVEAVDGSWIEAEIWRLNVNVASFRVTAGQTRELALPDGGYAIWWVLHNYAHQHSYKVTVQAGNRPPKAFSGDANSKSQSLFFRVGL
jgi:hypothetical protein